MTGATPEIEPDPTPKMLLSTIGLEQLKRNPARTHMHPDLLIETIQSYSMPCSIPTKLKGGKIRRRKRNKKRKIIIIVS